MKHIRIKPIGKKRTKSMLNVKIDRIIRDNGNETLFFLNVFGFVFCSFISCSFFCLFCFVPFCTVFVF